MAAPHSTSTRTVEHATRAACRFCAAPLQHSVVDLGMSPLCESFLRADQLDQGETFYPLHALVCERCFLVQLRDYVAADHIFDEYAYFSSFSTSWLKHAADYCAQVTRRFGLSGSSFAVEIASNDGYLLQNFVAGDIPCLGVEPSWNVAEAAREKGVDTLTKFFGVATANEIVSERGQADLVLGNNVLAHVPDLNDFVGGIKALLAPQGVVTLEFPHLMRLMDEVQYDTIYHEHFSYLSFGTVQRVCAAHGLELFDVEELPSHGGSLRIYAQHESGPQSRSSEVDSLLARERAAGFEDLATYSNFTEQVQRSKRATLRFLIDAREAGKKVVAYGAPGKGNTLLNYCGIGTDLIEFAVDRNPYKHGRFTPGAHIPILPPEALDEARPDYVFILPWNLQREITAQLAHVRDWGGRFVVPIPEARVLDAS